MKASGNVYLPAGHTAPPLPVKGTMNNYVSTPTTMIVTDSTLADARKAFRAGWASFDTDAGDGTRLWADVRDVLGCEAGDIVDAIRDTPASIAYA